MSIYLYVKQCNHCNLKYFGKTVKPTVEKYLGSGHHWRRHIKMHGKKLIITTNIWEFDVPMEASEFALQFSKDNNIVESVEWANLIPEDGLDGNSSAVITDQLRQKFKIANAGKNNPMFGTIWITNGIENKKTKGDALIPEGWSKGRYFNEESRKKFVSRSKVGKNNTRYDATLYHFKNEKTGQEYKMTSYDFRKSMCYRSNPIRNLVNGKRNSYKDWVIIKDYFEI